jgi:hypothetical protein
MHQARRARAIAADLSADVEEPADEMKGVMGDG